MEIEEINQPPGKTRKRIFNPNQPLPPALLRGQRPILVGRQPQIWINNSLIINKTVNNNKPNKVPGLRNRYTSLNYFSF
jgi:hypothetical protein